MAVGEVKIPVAPNFSTAIRQLPSGSGKSRAPSKTTDEQRAVHHVAMPDDPTDVGSCPPHVTGLQPKTPSRHRGDVHLIPTVSMDRQLGRRGGSRGRQDEGRLVGLHRLHVVRLPFSSGEKGVPRNVPAGMERNSCRGALQHDNVLDQIPHRPQGLVDERLERNLLALAVGDVGREDDTRAACGYPVR